MMRMQYKLIVSDFDGTLRDSRGGVSQENVDAVEAYIDAGGIFVLCTGRMTPSILPYAKQLGLKGLVAAYQGSVIRDISSGKYLRDQRIDWHDAFEICEFLQKYNLHIHVYDGDIFYVNRDDHLREMYEKTCNVRGILQQNSISETVFANKISPNKIIIMCEPEDRAKILKLIDEQFGNRFYVTTSMGQLVELVERGCDKGGALRFLSDFYQIPLSQTIAIGDNYNDLPMIQAAGLGVAVQNGEDSLKMQADYVTDACDNGGVAHVIRKFGLGE